MASKLKNRSDFYLIWMHGDSTVPLIECLSKLVEYYFGSGRVSVNVNNVILITSEYTCFHVHLTN